MKKSPWTTSCVHTASVRWRISLTLYGALSKCIVGPSILSASSPASKSWEMLNFSGSNGSVGQLDRVMQICANTLSNKITFVMQPGKTHAYVKRKPPYRHHPFTEGCSVNAVSYTTSNTHQFDLHTMFCVAWWRIIVWKWLLWWQYIGV